MLEHILKLPEEEAAVVEHAVQHDADAPLVGLLHQFHQGTLIPEMRVDTGVIVGVVLMVCGSFKNRRKVQGVDTQLRKIGKLLDDAGQVAAEEIHPVRLPTPLADSFRREGRISVAEALRENLIEYRTVDPGRLFVHVDSIDKGKLKMDETDAVMVNIHAS